MAQIYLYFCLLTQKKDRVLKAGARNRSVVCIDTVPELINKGLLENAKMSTSQNCRVHILTALGAPPNPTYSSRIRFFISCNNQSLHSCNNFSMEKASKNNCLAPSSKFQKCCGDT